MEKCGHSCLDVIDKHEVNSKVIFFYWNEDKLFIASRENL